MADRSSQSSSERTYRGFQIQPGSRESRFEALEPGFGGSTQVEDFKTTGPEALRDSMHQEM